MSERDDLNETRRWTFGAEAINNIVQTIAILAAGAWGVYTFIYQAEIAPAREPASLSVTSTVTDVGHKGNQVAIRSTVTRSNVGHTPVRLLALTYNVVGAKVRFGEKAAADVEPADLERVSNLTHARYYDEPEQQVILRHGVLFKGAARDDGAHEAPDSVLNPGESVSRDMIFYADRETFDFVRFQVRLSYAKESDPPSQLHFTLDERNELEATPVSPCPPDHDECVVTTDFATDLSLW
ncbi:MAG: hypothetical protein U1E83_01370 [Methylotetracoccus sp.]